jgi:hypothetical protein
MRATPFMAAAAAAIVVLAACDDHPSTAPAATRHLIDVSLAKNSGPRCRIGFSLVLDESQAMKSDGGGAYVNKVEGVLVATDGTGLRFDTNTSQDKEAATDLRRVQLDFPDSLQQHADTLKGVDFRLDHNADPINLCGMAEGSTASIEAVLSFESSATGAIGHLQYGGFWVEHDCGTLGVPELAVTRTSSNTWTIASGTSACLYFGTTFQGVTTMPIAFTITSS